MFIGHFAVGLAAKKASPKINLGILFINIEYVCVPCLTVKN